LGDTSNMNVVPKHILSLVKVFVGTIDTYLHWFYYGIHIYKHSNNSLHTISHEMTYDHGMMLMSECDNAHANAMQVLNMQG